MDSLSQKAKEIYNKLQQQMQEVVAADKVREPKLTDEEKAELIKLEASIEKYQPIHQRLLDLTVTRSERLKYLERNSHKIIIDGGDVDEVVAELALLPAALELLDSARRGISTEITVANHAIKRMKENARVRELRQEAQ